MMESNEFDISLYDDEFFAWHAKYAHDYSIRNMQWLLESPFCTGHNQIKSVLDIGCGIGSYLQAALNAGKKIMGYEIALDKALRYMDTEVATHVVQWDCTELLPSFRTLEKMGYQPIRKFDLVMSFETAEHIRPEGTGTFILNIVSSLADNGMILFTGAPPGQDGCGHINCRPKQQWIDLFMEMGLVQDKESEWEIAAAWRKQECPPYIADNLICLRDKLIRR